MGKGRCYYEVLSVPQDAAASEIKKCYRAMALKYHPDKNAGDDEATEIFKQVREAYEVLSDPEERSYYDDNRGYILDSDEEEDDNDEPYNEVEAHLDLYQWSSRDAFDDFTSDTSSNFYKVYDSVFRDLDHQEKTAKNGDDYRPGFGDRNCPLGSVRAFYAYWHGFATCRSELAFAKHDKWDLNDAPSPLMRRLMQQKNSTLRAKARHMFNDKVRRLATWVQSNDPRLSGLEDFSFSSAQQPPPHPAPEDIEESYRCAACNKTYKNQGMLTNHEKSGKHKQAVAKAREQFAREAVGDLDLQEMGETLGEMGLEDPVPQPRGKKGGGGKGKKGKGKGNEEDWWADEDEYEGRVEEKITHADCGDETDAAIEQAMAAAASALPSPGLVALQTREAVLETKEYKKLNKTQRRKALVEWEAENERLMDALRAEGMDVPPPKEKVEKAVEEVTKTAKADRTKVHAAGAHSRESKTLGKKKLVYGAKAKAAKHDDSD